MIVSPPSLSLAPGCFGLAMTYRATARECAVCPFANACAPLAESNLIALRAELGIVTPPSAADRKGVARDKDATPTLPKKVAAHIERLNRVGIKVAEALASGENPFSVNQRPAFLRIACHLLLKLKQGVSRDLLIQCFMQRLQHAPETAAAHAKQTVQILEAIGVARERDGLLQLRTPQC